MGWHCAWGRVKHGTAEKKENKSGCFLLFLSVSLFSNFTSNIILLYRIYSYIFYFYIKIISKSSIVVPFFFNQDVLVSSQLIQIRKTRLFGLFRDEEVKGGIRILTWRIRPQERSEGSEGLADIFGGEVLLKENQTGAYDDPNIWGTIGKFKIPLNRKDLRWKSTILKHTWRFCLDG